MLINDNKQIQYIFCTGIKCYACLILTFLPILSFIFFGKKAYNDLKFETLDLALPTMTWIHFIKFTLCVSLAIATSAIIYGFVINTIKFVGFICLAGITFLCWVTYIFSIEKNIKDLMGQIGALIILRKEYKKFGYTSQYLMLFWRISMLFHIIATIIFNPSTCLLKSNKDPNDFIKYGVVSLLGLELILNIFSWIFTKDSSKAIDVDDIADQYIAIKERNIKESYISSNISSKENPELVKFKFACQVTRNIIFLKLGSLNENEIRTRFQNYAKKKEVAMHSKIRGVQNSSQFIQNISVDRIGNEEKEDKVNDILLKFENHDDPQKSMYLTESMADDFEASNINTDKLVFDGKLTTNNGSITTSTSFNSRSIGIYDIRVTHCEEIMIQQDKKLIGYVINYNTENEQVKVIRTYSEFHEIYNKVKLISFYWFINWYFFVEQIANMINMPELAEMFNQKNNVMPTEENHLKYRISIFDEFLKNLIIKRMITQDLIDFLSPLEPIHHHSSSDMQNIDENSEVIQKSLPVKSQREVGTNSKNKPQSYKFHLPNSSKINSSFNPLANRKDIGSNSTPYNNFNFRNDRFITQNIIKDYTNHLSSNQQLEDFNYQIEISDSTIVNNSIYYQISIYNTITSTSHCVKRRYQEFRILQNALSEYTKSKGYNLPELPNRGSLGTLISKYDSKLIEYRKFALRNYLQEIINTKKYFKCLAFMHFLELSITPEQISFLKYKKKNQSTN